jgi:hypothetical protein
MKRLLIFVLLFASAFCSSGQTVGVKISELTTYLGAGDSAYVPVTIGGATRKMFGKDLARGKVDSVKIVSGTLYFYKGGTGYSAGSVATSQAFADLTGKPTTLSGYGIADAVSEGRFLDSLQDVRAAITASGGSSYTPTGNTSTATTLTLTTDYDNYVFTGSSATTWTLPAVSGNSWKRLTLVNTGTATITMQRAGSDNIYTTTTVTSLTIYPGEVYELLNTSTYWKVKS